MTAIGFAVFTLCALYYKSKDYAFWMMHPKLQSWIEIIGGFALLSLVAGIATFLWRTMP